MRSFATGSSVLLLLLVASFTNSVNAACILPKFSAAVGEADVLSQFGGAFYDPSTDAVTLGRVRHIENSDFKFKSGTLNSGSATMGSVFSLPGLNGIGEFMTVTHTITDPAGNNYLVGAYMNDSTNAQSVYILSYTSTWDLRWSWKLQNSIAADVYSSELAIIPNSSGDADGILVTGYTYEKLEGASNAFVSPGPNAYSARLSPSSGHPDWIYQLNTDSNTRAHGASCTSSSCQILALKDYKWGVLSLSTAGDYQSYKDLGRQSIIDDSGCIARRSDGSLTVAFAVLHGTTTIDPTQIEAYLIPSAGETTSLPHTALLGYSKEDKAVRYCAYDASGAFYIVAEGTLNPKTQQTTTRVIARALKYTNDDAGQPTYDVPVSLDASMQVFVGKLIAADTLFIAGTADGRVVDSYGIGIQDVVAVRLEPSATFGLVCDSNVDPNATPTPTSTAEPTQPLTSNSSLSPEAMWGIIGAVIALVVLAAIVITVFVIRNRQRNMTRSASRTAALSQMDSMSTESKFTEAENDRYAKV